MSRLPVKVRTARKPHWCDDHDTRHIKPGDRYEIWTEEPHGEVFNTDGWSVHKSCAAAAATRGRDLYADTTQEPARA